jgi:hypothetical protein
MIWFEARAVVPATTPTLAVGQHGVIDAGNGDFFGPLFPRGPELKFSGDVSRVGADFESHDDRHLHLNRVAAEQGRRQGGREQKQAQGRLAFWDGWGSHGPLPSREHAMTIRHGAALALTRANLR